MVRSRRLRLTAGTALVIGVFFLNGCAQLGSQLGYYAQAVQGQMSLLSEAKPIDRWLSDPGVKDDLKSRLKRVREIRQFAANDLGLPDNGSYKNFADIKRAFVMWNVVATPELSLKPEQWCFPVAGCVDYRGYYDKGAAQSFASGLRARGLDVRVTGVPAYSTLGWFNDPVLSTFIHYPRIMNEGRQHRVIEPPQSRVGGNAGHAHIQSSCTQTTGEGLRSTFVVIATIINTAGNRKTPLLRFERKLWRGNDIPHHEGSLDVGKILVAAIVRQAKVIGGELTDLANPLQTGFQIVLDPGIGQPAIDRLGFRQQ